MVLTYSYTLAQQPAICGDWVGVFENTEISDDAEYPIKRNYKRTIRIKKIEDHYTVRMKIQRADGSGNVSYISGEQITSADEYHISWMYDRGLGDSGEYHYYLYCSVTLINGVLKYSEYWITEYPGGGRRKWGESSNQSLYKDEGDW